MFTALWNSSTPGWQWAAVICGTLLAAVYDVRTRRIPNWLTGSLLLAGAIWVSVFGGLAGLGDGLAGCVLCALPFVVLYIVGGGGAADAKVMGAVGMWLGVRNGVVTMTAVLIAGAVLGIVYALSKRRLESVVVNLSLAGFGLAKLLTRQQKWSQAAEVLPGENDMLPMPYGLSIFVGVCVAAWGVLAWKTGRI